MPYIAYTTWERVQFQNYDRENLQKKIEVLNLGRDSLSPHLRLECKIPLSEIEAREDLIKCFQSQIGAGEELDRMFKS